MILNHNQKMEIIEVVWDLDNKIKQLKSQIEIRGITTKENSILQEIEQEVKELQLCLQESLPEKPIGYIFKTLLN